MDDGFADAVGRIDKLESRVIAHRLLVHVADVAVRNPPLQDHRSVAKRQPDFVQGIQVQRKGRFNQAAAEGHFPDRERLENHHLAVQLAENLNPIVVALVVERVRHGR